jgi:integrase
MCLWLGIRITQCQTPLDAFHLERPIPIVKYPGQIERNGVRFNLVKGKKGQPGKGYTQVIPGLFIPRLKELWEHRKDLGEERLCDLPRWPNGAEYGPGRASLLWRRKVLNKLGFTDISIHGLRARWVTLTRRSGVSKEVTMHAVNHSSEKIHDQYTHLVPEDSAAELNAVAHIIGCIAHR